jgi:hypothetical protein
LVAFEYTLRYFTVSIRGNALHGSNQLTAIPPTEYVSL